MRLAAWVILAALAAPSAWAAPGTDQEPGQVFHLTADRLPAPHATDSVANGPDRIERPEGAAPIVPAGFTAELFAEGLRHARWMVVAANGDVILAQPKAGELTLLRDEDGDGRADLAATFLAGLTAAHGLAIRGDALYIGDLEGVWRVPYAPGDVEARADPVRITADGAFGSEGGHWTRNIAFSADGSLLYAAIGSRGNTAEEAEPRATVQVFDARGGEGRTFAAGLRNPVGIAIHPGTGELYVTVNERDGLGDGLVPDYFTRIREGEFYGWPYAYIGQHPDPDYGERRPDLVAATKVPDVLFESHSAPLGLAFYAGDQFPPEYRDGAFVALHGSWNRAAPTGYKVVYVPFRDGRPTGAYRNFATGFWIAGEDTAGVWGRPCGLAVMPDGSLLVSDDAGGTIWRIRYTGP